MFFKKEKEPQQHHVRLGNAFNHDLTQKLFIQLLRELSAEDVEKVNLQLENYMFQHRSESGMYEVGIGGSFVWVGDLGTPRKDLNSEGYEKVSFRGNKEYLNFEYQARFPECPSTTVKLRMKLKESAIGKTIVL